MKYDKPFKTYEELISIIQSRNIIVQDKAFAVHALENFSYYGIINGYKNTFLQFPESDLFIPGTKFEELYTLHLIDSSLNNIIFKYILFLEKSLKSRISYLVSQKYGVYTDYNNQDLHNPNDYLCQKYYSNSYGNRYNILLSLKKSLSAKTHNPIILHYIKSKNHIPPWILTTNLTFGLTLEWYGILRSDDKESICNTFISPGKCSASKTKEFIKKAFELTKEYRNKIAHGNRTFNIPNLPRLPREQLMAFSFNIVSQQEYNSQLCQNDTMAVLVALVIMLNDKYILNNFLLELNSLIAPYAKSNIRFNNKSIFDIFGFPSDILKRLSLLIKRKFS